MSADKAPAGQTVEAARRALSARFKSAGIESAELDARILVGAVLKLDLTALIVSAARRMSQAEAAELELLARRRQNGEPVARILGHKEFWGLPFKLSAATLVPRPETETVVELALQFIHRLPASATKSRIADLGTGSGAILLSLLHEVPAASGVGTDIAFEALQTARQNAVELGLSARACFVACGYAEALSGGFDLIVSNPPYIRSADLAGLDAEVRDHDPRAALDGGIDGLDAYRTLIPQAARLLAPAGALIVEAGQGQSGPIEALMTAAGLTTDEGTKTDMAGIPRAVMGRKLPR